MRLIYLLPGWVSDGLRVCYIPPVLIPSFPVLVMTPSVFCMSASATVQFGSALVPSTCPEAWGSHKSSSLPWHTLLCKCPPELGRYGLGLVSFVQGECQHPESGTVGGKQAVLCSRLMAGSIADDQGSQEAGGSHHK